MMYVRPAARAPMPSMRNPLKRTLRPVKSEISPPTMKSERPHTTALKMKAVLPGRLHETNEIPIPSGPDSAISLYDAGATIVCNGVERWHAPLRNFTRALSIELGLPPNMGKCNLYMSPAGAGLPAESSPPKPDALTSGRRVPPRDLRPRCAVEEFTEHRRQLPDGHADLLH